MATKQLKKRALHNKTSREKLAFHKKSFDDAFKNLLGFQQNNITGTSPKNKGI